MSNQKKTQTRKNDQQATRTYAQREDEAEVLVKQERTRHVNASNPMKSNPYPYPAPVDIFTIEEFATLNDARYAIYGRFQADAIIFNDRKLFSPYTNAEEWIIRLQELDVKRATNDEYVLNVHHWIWGDKRDDIIKYLNSHSNTMTADNINGLSQLTGWRAADATWVYFNYKQGIRHDAFTGIPVYAWWKGIPSLSALGKIPARVGQPESGPLPDEPDIEEPGAPSEPPPTKDPREEIPIESVPLPNWYQEGEKKLQEGYERLQKIKDEMLNSGIFAAKVIAGGVVVLWLSYQLFSPASVITIETIEVGGRKRKRSD